MLCGLDRDSKVSQGYWPNTHDRTLKFFSKRGPLMCRNLQSRARFNLHRSQRWDRGLVNKGVASCCVRCQRCGGEAEAAAAATDAVSTSTLKLPMEVSNTVSACFCLAFTREEQLQRAQGSQWELSSTVLISHFSSSASSSCICSIQLAYVNSIR